MRHYHGTPLGGTRDSVARFVATGNRHFLVPFGREEDLPIVAEASTGFCLDNGAFSAWKTGKPIADWAPYHAWVEAWYRHPRFDFAFIPDVIDGTEEENDRLVEEFRCSAVGRFGVPVWHLNESLQRLEKLAEGWSVVALGSSGQYSKPRSEIWNRRMSDAMSVWVHVSEERAKGFGAGGLGFVHGHGLFSGGKIRYVLPLGVKTHEPWFSKHIKRILASSGNVFQRFSRTRITPERVAKSRSKVFSEMFLQFAELFAKMLQGTNVFPIQRRGFAAWCRQVFDRFVNVLHRGQSPHRIHRRPRQVALLRRRRMGR